MPTIRNVSLDLDPFSTEGELGLSDQSFRNKGDSSPKAFSSRAPGCGWSSKVASSVHLMTGRAWDCGAWTHDTPLETPRTAPYKVNSPDSTRMP